MKNTGQNFFAFAFLLVLSGVLFLSCGLDVVYALDAPVSKYNTPLYSTVDESTCYVDFVTTEASNNAYDSFTFLGTAVYYKIYNNYSTLSSQVSTIEAADTSTNAGAAAKMITTYTYQPLGTNYNMSWAVFIPNGNANRRVRFRLKNVNNTSPDSYSSEMIALISHNYETSRYLGYKSGSQVSYTCTTVDGEEVWKYNDVEFALADTYPQDFIFPYRYDFEHSFDFFDNNDDDDEDKIDIEPQEGDADYYYSSTFTEEDKYYVQLFAVGVGRDTTYTLSYSKVLNLGIIPIWK